MDNRDKRYTDFLRSTYKKLKTLRTGGSVYLEGLKYTNTRDKFSLTSIPDSKEGFITLIMALIYERR